MITRSRRQRPWQQTQKGQVLLIFALTSIVLFAIMGLAVDAGISYLHSDQQQKAAAAAALSGVGYLPGDFTDASKEATITAQRDGYTAGGSGTSAVTISVTQPTGYTNELQVAITAPAPVYFLELLGFGQHEVTASAIAEYLPPIQLGAPGASLGATISQLESNTGYYFLRSEGWGNPRSEGDPFTPTPDENSSSCGPTSTSCLATSSPDVHQISCIDGDDLCNGQTGTNCGTGSNQLCLNDVGGQNYLIYVPAGTTAGVSVYNPGFDPGDDGGCPSQTASCLDTYHEDDGSFPTIGGISAADTPVDTDFDSMGYTLFAVPDLNNRSADIPLLQDIFCPFNAYDLDTGTVAYSYYQAGASGNTASGCDPAGNNATLDTVNNSTPADYNAPPSGEASDGNNYTPVGSGSSATNGWIPLTAPSSVMTGTSAHLFYQSYNTLASETAYTTNSGGNYYLTGGSSGQYYRLRVDTLAWNGAVINTSNSTNSPSANSGSLPNGYPLGHNAYSVEATTTSAGTQCGSCTTSAMADMTIYTPINGSKATSFDVPLFYLPSEYAGKVIQVSAFDPGDVGGGDAYIGILQPAYTPTTGPASPKEYATLANNTDGTPAVNDIGTSLGSGSSTPITVNDGTNPNAYIYTANSAIVQTATGTGTAIYNGQWVQFNIQVPSNYNPGAAGTNTYWNLYYQVAGAAYAGDTLAFEVQYLGSPVHLCTTPACP